jgi:hypothetical protein
MICSPRSTSIRAASAPTAGPGANDPEEAEGSGKGLVKIHETAPEFVDNSGRFNYDEKNESNIVYLHEIRE